MLGRKIYQIEIGWTKIKLGWGSNHGKVYQNCVTRHLFFLVIDTWYLNNHHAFIMNLFTQVHRQDLAQV